MNTSSPLYSRFSVLSRRSPYYTRLDNKFVECFAVEKCPSCAETVSFNSVIIDASDEELSRVGMARVVKPSLGHRLSPSDVVRCTKCHNKWMDPYRQRRLTAVK